MKMDKCESCGTSGCGHRACGCMCHKFIPALVIIAGLLILGFACLNIGWITLSPAAGLTYVKVVFVAIPLFLVLGGLKAMFGNKCKCC